MVPTWALTLALEVLLLKKNKAGGEKEQKNNTTACVLWCDLRSDSAMPTGVKLATDGKVDGHEANSCAKLGPQMLQLQEQAMEYIFTNRSCKNVSFPLFICVNPNETLGCYYAALFHSVGGQLSPHPADARLASIWTVNQLITLKRKRKEKRNKKDTGKSTCTHYSDHMFHLSPHF